MSSLVGMARRATGTIETHAWKDGRTATFRIRVRNLGQRYRIDLGTNHEGWSVERAPVELDDILRQIERGTLDAPRFALRPCRPGRRTMRRCT